MDGMLREFLTEASESVSLLDLELARLEKNPNDPQLLGNIFRLVHTIRDACGFVGLPRLLALAYAAENVLGKVRNGELTFPQSGVGLILESLDRIKGLLSVIEQTEAEPERDDGDIVRRLDALAGGRVAVVPTERDAVQGVQETPI